jgi:imidazole glycerol-phosphate synthase subunit HisF
MKRARIIPVLLLQNNGLAKTIRFGNARYIGDPINAVRIFNDKQCDELIFLDILASKLNREIDYNQIEEIASECFMPFAYGGGIKNTQQIEHLLKLGIEKVILNSVVLAKPDFIKEAVRYFGSSTIVVSVDVKKNFLGKYFVYNHTLKPVPEKSFLDYLKWIEQQGVGEVMLNSVDNDGMMKGYDEQLALKASELLSMPVVICGGCGSLEDTRKILVNTQVSAAAAGSYFIFHGPHRAVLISYPSPEQISNIYK